MSKWKLSEAKARFSEVVAKSSREPQVLVNRNKPVAAIISIKAFKRLKRGAQDPEERPSVEALLEELSEINQTEAALEVPPRRNRPLPPID